MQQAICGTSAISAAKTAKITSPTPSSLVVTATSAIAITVTWDKVPNANSYIIEYSVDFDAVKPTILKKTFVPPKSQADNSSYSLTGLKAAPLCFVRIVAVGERATM